MSLNDIPGTVTFKRNWPLGLVLMLYAAVLMFVFETRSSLADFDKRALKLETKEERRTDADAKISSDVAVIKAVVEAIRDEMRERRTRVAPQ